MGAILDALHQLQKIESELNTFRSKEQSLRRKVRQVTRQIEQRQAESHAHHETITRCQMEIDQADLDIKSREESMAKHRQALNVAKSNKEYAAILTALNTEKADSAKCESRVLELMARKEELVGESQTHDGELERLQTRLAKAEDAVRKFTEDNRATFERLEAERADAAAALPASALSTFDRVAARHEGDALAETVRVSARGEEHICGGLPHVHPAGARQPPPQPRRIAGVQQLRPHPLHRSGECLRLGRLTLRLRWKP
jgi:predicted  nucleic acid-binding Zn-ribbon protein